MPLFRVPLSQQQSPFVHPPHSNPSSQNSIPSTPGGIGSSFNFHNLIPSSTKLNSNSDIFHTNSNQIQIPSKSHQQQSNTNTNSSQNQAK